MDGEAYVITFGSLGTDDDRFAALSVGTGAGVVADTGAEAGAEHSNTEPPSAEPSVQAVRFLCLGYLTHPNPYDALCDGDGEDDDDGDMVNEVDEKQLGTENEVCLRGTVWRRWTASAPEDVVCLRGTLWKRWTRVVDQVTGWIIRTKNIGVARGRKKSGCRRSRHKNRRRREKRRRQALRHKRRCRRGRGLKGRRRRVSLRGGEDPDEQQQQQQELGKGRRNRRRNIFGLVAIKNGASFQINNAGNSADIHKMSGSTNEDIEVQLQRQDDIARRIREREAHLSVEARAATTRNLLLQRRWRRQRGKVQGVRASTISMMTPI